MLNESQYKEMISSYTGRMSEIEKMACVAKQMSKEGQHEYVQQHLQKIVGLTYEANQYFDMLNQEWIERKAVISQLTEQNGSLKVQLNKLAEKNQNLIQTVAQTQWSEASIREIVGVFLKREENKHQFRSFFIFFIELLIGSVFAYVAYMVVQGLGFPEGELVDNPWAWITYILRMGGSIFLSCVMIVTLARFISNESANNLDVGNLLKELKSSTKSEDKQ